VGEALSSLIYWNLGFPRELNMPHSRLAVTAECGTTVAVAQPACGVRREVSHNALTPPRPAPLNLKSVLCSCLFSTEEKPCATTSECMHLPRRVLDMLSGVIRATYIS
jgi:hypothetical protein